MSESFSSVFRYYKILKWNTMKKLQVVFFRIPAEDFLWWFYKEKRFQIFFLSSLFCKSSPKVVFYYKGFLQMYSKIVELWRKNISSEAHLNCWLMLLRGILFFRFFWESQYVSTSKPNWILRKKTKVWKKEIEMFASLFI